MISCFHTSINVRVIVAIHKIPKYQSGFFRRWGDLFNDQRIKSQTVKAGIDEPSELLIPPFCITPIAPLAEPAFPASIPRAVISPCPATISRIADDDAQLPISDLHNP
jgi:hypothetical protein